MGSVGFAMPLLSTLAALVIIVHSAEEDYDQNYRVLMPKSLDIDSPREDQPWRMIEAEPKLKQTSPITQSDTWDDIGPEPPIPRRRPVRKRKRRPQLSIEDDLIPQGSYIYNEETQPHLQDNGNRPRRRRKKIIYQDSNEDGSQEHGLSEENLNRPKRRGQKRKRPLLDSWPELSEFGTGYRQEVRNNSVESTDNTEIRYINAQDDNESSRNEAHDKINYKVQIYNKNEQHTETTTPEIIDSENQSQMVPKDEEKSLSEFSIESMRPYKKPSITTISTKEKIIDKVSLANNIDQHKIERILLLKKKSNDFLQKCIKKIRILSKRTILGESYIRIKEDNSREKAPLDPFILKMLLKKSNGKSLSEILQQNNLSLADLLHGKEKALSVLKQESLSETQLRGQNINLNTLYYNSDSSTENIEALRKKDSSEPAKTKQESEQLEVETSTQLFTTREDLNLKNEEIRQNDEPEDLMISKNSQENSAIENSRRAHMRRRFSGGIRRKLRIRPTSNNNYKSQLSRDLIALTSLKYKNNRNVSRSLERKEIIPSINKTDNFNNESDVEVNTESESLTTTPCALTDTTMQENYETITDSSDVFTNTQPTIEVNNETEKTPKSDVPYFEMDNTDLAQFTTATLTNVNVESDKDIVTHPTHLPILKPLINSSDLRQQTFNNRIKRKRLKQRSSTTQAPEELKVKDTFGVDKLESASEFIAKTQTRTSKIKDDDFVTLDYMTTEPQRKILSHLRSRRPLNAKNLTALPSIQIERINTEETAKIEIDEILNDNQTSSELTKILKERNMTINELIEHRERGSSHVHLADIFHNASKEPNPPEPFLSKSLIEPISKETYPLRALLEANTHDPKTTTIDPNSSYIKNINIPVVMDFGNNVNENGENLGIITVFNNLSETNTDKLNLKKEKVKISYDSSNDVEANLNNKDQTRHGRMYNSEKDSVTWNDLIALMQKNQKENLDSQISLANDSPISETLKKIAFDEDVDSDALIILDNLQQLRNFESKTSSDELLELKMYERNKSPQIPIMSNFVTDNTRSVTIATASIIGLALILFLLTYVVLKWKQQSKIFQNKHAHEDDFVPTPVFESRKCHKINSSIRSKSPMLASSSVYAIDTIDTRAGSESPEYMWDTLRKPFQ